MSTVERASAVPAGSYDQGVDRSMAFVARLARTPAVWLAAVVGASTALRVAIGLQVESVWILPDEILYSELAKGIAASGEPAIRGLGGGSWELVYPTLIAPAWAIFENQQHAYHGALGINALLMSLTAIPAYLLARMFVSSRSGFVVAAFTVAVPSLGYTGVLLTENAAYPAFLLATLLVARAVRTPTLTAQAFALVGLGLVALTRVQALALFAAYAGAVATYAVTAASGTRWRYLRRYVPTSAAASAVWLAPTSVSLAKGDGPLAWLGWRLGIVQNLRPAEIPEWFVYLVTDLVLYVAVAPAAAVLILVARGVRRDAPERIRLFAAVAVSTCLALLVSIAVVSASVDVDGTENLNERYVFYLVPLSFVGLALWFETGLPRPRRVVWGVLASFALMAFLLPIDRLGYSANFQSLALLPWIALPLSGVALNAVLTGFVLVSGLLWATCRPEQAGRVWLLTLGMLAVVGALVVSSHAVSSHRSATAYRGQSATWVDDVVPAGERVAAIWGERPSPYEAPRRWYFWLMVTELFNDRVADVYRLGGSSYYEGVLPTIPVRSRPDLTMVDGRGRQVEASYALVTCSTNVAGRSLARAPSGGLMLVEVDPPLRLAPRSGCARFVP